MKTNEEILLEKIMKIYGVECLTKQDIEDIIEELKREKIKI